MNSLPARRPFGEGHRQRRAVHPRDQPAGQAGDRRAVLVPRAHGERNRPARPHPRAARFRGQAQAQPRMSAEAASGTPPASATLTDTELHPGCCP